MRESTETPQLLWLPIFYWGPMIGLCAKSMLSVTTLVVVGINKLVDPLSGTKEHVGNSVPPKRLLDPSPKSSKGNSKNDIFVHFYSSEKPKSRKSSTTNVAAAMMASRPIITVDYPFIGGLASCSSSASLSGSPSPSASMSTSSSSRQRKTSYVRKMWQIAKGKD